METVFAQENLIELAAAQVKEGTSNDHNLESLMILETEEAISKHISEWSVSDVNYQYVERNAVYPISLCHSDTAYKKKVFVINTSISVDLKGDFLYEHIVEVKNHERNGESVLTIKTPNGILQPSASVISFECTDKSSAFISFDLEFVVYAADYKEALTTLVEMVYEQQINVERIYLGILYCGGAGEVMIPEIISAKLSEYVDVIAEYGSLEELNEVNKDDE